MLIFKIENEEVNIIGINITASISLKQQSKNKEL